MMKAIVRTAYGSPDVLQLKEIERPVPRNNELLIRVHATSLNASDVEFLTGKPLYTRMWGLFKPKIQILGSDIAGRVEAAGPEARRFKAGDAVFGDIFDHWGGLAEHVCVPEDKLTQKPDGLTFDQAAAVPQASLVALQGLQNKRQIQAGQKILINGAGGGAGSFAIQIAKHLGAEVTGVDSAEKLEMMRSLAADHVTDYTREDFTRNGKTYDLILDLVASHSICGYRKSLSVGGTYLMAGGSMKHIFQTLFFGSLLSLTGKKKMRILGVKPNKDLDIILNLIESGNVTPVIDRRFALSEAPRAFQHLQDGHAKGKIVIKLINE
jgi:NADPH:quinone reductase-like Zn-dependent oxidoreductase